MENEHMLSGLARRRAELTGEANALKAHLARIAGDIAQIDAVIRLFNPGYDVDGIKPKRPQAVDSAVRGDMARFVLGGAPGSRWAAHGGRPGAAPHGGAADGPGRPWARPRHRQGGGDGAAGAGAGGDGAGRAGEARVCRCSAPGC